jgi:endonuclease G
MTKFEGYFNMEELDAIAVALRDGLGPHEDGTRRVLLDSLPRPIADLMPGGSAPRIQLLKDLGFLNGLERLADGTVPLIAFLRMALRVGGAVESMNVVADALSKLEVRTSGAPQINLATMPEVRERIIGKDDMVPYGFFAGGLAVAGAVARLEVPRFDDGLPHKTGGSQTRYLGTGWLIGRGLLITNHHVINARNDGEPQASEADLNRQAEATRSRFDYDFQGVTGTEVALTQLVCSDAGLDYAICRLNIDRLPLTLATGPMGPITPDSYVAVNIVQHPDGRPKQFGVRNNLVIGATDRDLRYFTDTDGGSSGSPVLDDEWKVVALHRGSTFAKDVQYQGRSTAYVNLGTQIHAVLAHIRTHAPKLATELRVG